MSRTIKNRATSVPQYLLDVNTLIAILDEDHTHHVAATKWFSTVDRWALCPFTEAGFLRHMTRAVTGGLSVDEATKLLTHLTSEPGFSYQPIPTGWQTLAAPFLQRVFGHNQITDAFLLGLAIEAGLILATFDRAILHMAGEYRNQVLLLVAEQV